MDRICENTLAWRHLKAIPRWNGYAACPTTRPRPVVKKPDGRTRLRLLTSACRARAAGARFLDALQLFTRLVEHRRYQSLAAHPASTTHRQLSPRNEEAGVSEETVRLCAGIEHIDDLRADLDAALARWPDERRANA